MVPGTQMKWVDLLWVHQGDHCDDPQADHCEVRCFPVVRHLEGGYLVKVAEAVNWVGFPVVLEEAVVNWGVLGAEGEIKMVGKLFQITIMVSSNARDP